MSNLRDEVAILGGSLSRLVNRDEVLALIDKYEAARKEYGETRCTRCSNERPAYCLQCWEGATKTSRE